MRTLDKQTSLIYSTLSVVFGLLALLMFREAADIDYDRTTDLLVGGCLLGVAIIQAALALYYFMRGGKRES